MNSIADPIKSATPQPAGNFLGKRIRLKLASGDLAKIPTKRALQVWLGLLAHANREGLAWPSDKTLAEAWGIDERTIRRGKTELLELGHIKRTKRLAGERGPAIYKINLEPTDRTTGVRSDSEPTGQYTDPDRTVMGSRPDNFDAPTGHTGVRLRHEGIESTTNSEVVGLLRSLGINQADKLASTPGITLDLIDRIAKQAGTDHPGTLHNKIAAAARTATAQAEARAARARQDDERAEQRERERAEQAERQVIEQADHDRAVEFIASIDDDTLERLRDQHVATQPAWLQHSNKVPSLDELRGSNRAIGLRSYRLAIEKLAETPAHPSPAPGKRLHNSRLEARR